MIRPMHAGPRPWCESGVRAEVECKPRPSQDVARIKTYIQDAKVKKGVVACCLDSQELFSSGLACVSLRYSRLFETF